MQKLKFVSSDGNEVSINDGFIYLQSITGLAEIGANNLSYTGYLQDGEIYKNSLFQSRPLEMEIIIKTNTINELLTTRQNILKTFNPKLGEGELFYSYNGIERKIKCVSDGTPTMQLIGDRVYCHGIIRLIAFDPFFTDVKTSKKVITNWKKTFHFPVLFPKEGITYGVKEPSLIVNIENKGDVECGMIIEFHSKGTVVNPSLFNVDTREFIKLNYTMSSDEIIRVNTNYGQKKITSILNQSEKNIMNAIDLESTFLQLNLGDNLLRYDADEFLNNLEVNIYFNTKYLGV